MNTETAPPQQFNDRRTGLVIFGGFTIIGGLVCGLFALLAALAPMMVAHSANPPPVRPHPFAGIILYGGLAIALVWLGIGSIMARRWARALLAIISWLFLIFGIGALGFLLVMAPQIKQGMAAARPPNTPPLSDSAQTAAIVGMFIFLGLFGIVGPLIWALFYSGRNVKATCEARDQVPRWTDRCPLPVLAISLWLLFGAVTLFGIAAFYPVAPFFGLLLTGNVARAYHICLALIWIYAARALYRLDRRGWWTVLIVITASTVSTLITFSLRDVTEIYALMGLPAQQLDAVQKFGFGGHMALWSLVGAVPTIAYLLYVRRFFTESASDPQPNLN